MGEKLSSSMVQIGIATRNRWEDLSRTLSKIVDFGLADVRTLIFDDASDESCPFDVTSICRRAELRRCSERRGYIVRRNELAREIDSKYYFSLDDDSFPVSGSLDAAVEFAESLDDLLCLSFPIYNPVLGQHQIKSIRDEPYRVRSFVGCGHLLNLRRFLELGGYREELVHQGEEVDVSARAFLDGMSCYHFPGLSIHHLASNADRNWHRMDFYGARNSALWNDWYMPARLRIVKQSRTLVARAIQVVKLRRLGPAQGQVSGLREISGFTSNRRSMSMKLYREWLKLPAV